MNRILFILFVLINNYSFGQNNPAYIDTLFYGKNGLENKLPNIGLSIGIYKEGKINYYSFGNTCHTNHQKVDSSTVFEIGSNTKLFTALLLALEIEEGKIPRAAFIDPYLRGEVSLKPALKNKIRLIDLAAYSSGLPTLHDDYYDSLLSVKDSMQPYKSVDKKYLYNILNNTSEIPNYGNYEYSNFNYALLGVILEKITTKKYTCLVQNNIFKPLKMNQSFTGEVPAGIAACGYYENKKVDYIKLDALKPAGVIKSNAKDMLRFIKYQLHPPGNTIGKAISLTQQVFTETEDFKTGLGWHIMDDDSLGTYYVMQGDTIGNSSLLFFDKKTDTGIVILLNQNNHNLTGIIFDYLLNYMN